MQTNLVTIPTALAMTRMQQQKAGTELDTWRCLTDAQRQRAMHRAALVQRVAADERLHGVTRRQAIRRLLTELDAGRANAYLSNAAAELARGGGVVPDEAQLYRWAKRFDEQGLPGLADGHKGRQRKVYGWEERAIALWLRPTKMAYATVAITLEREGWREVKEYQVRGFLKALPDELGGQNAPKRVGGHYYKLNFGKYQHRDSTVLPVGFIYEGDGHCCDVYVAHPNSGGHYRPELTVWIDLRTGLVAGWWLSNSESYVTSLYSLTHTLTTHDHVPAAIHVDPGSGYVNHGMCDELTGFLPAMSIELITALPGNAKGKGYTEGFFRWFEEREGKRWSTFMQRRTDDELRMMTRRIEKGQLYLPTQEEYHAGISSYMQWHNERHVDELGMSRLGFWEKHLERVPVVIPPEDLLRPREVRTVQNWSIRLWNRWYRANEMRHWNGKSVQVQYSLTDDSVVDIRDLKGRLICVAPLVRKLPWLEASRIQDLDKQRLDGQIERLEKKVEEKRAQARPVITHEAQAEALDLITPALNRLGTPVERASTPDFDPFDALSDPF